MKRGVVVLALALATTVVLTVILVLEDQGVVAHASRSFQPTARESSPEVSVTSAKNALLLRENDSTHAVRAMGVMAFNEGDYEAAARHFERHLQLRPTVIESYTNLAITRLCLNDLDGAWELCREGMRATDRRQPAPFYVILACIAQRQGRYAEAEGHLREATRHFPAELLLQFTEKEWAAPLRECRVIRDLAAEHAPPTPPADPAEATDTPPQP